ncbi:MAG: ABC transporter ATP-binding protein [Bacilli bacterium]|nr:ABC transporter ATP-binding protein [Bacilli bacterium]
MANLYLRHVYKVYPSRDKGPSFFKRLFSKKAQQEKPKDFVAVKDFNLDIKEGEFIVFVGPSGCGKSTTLRMIAGLEDISAGELYMDDVLLNNVDPMDRDMAMVFQSYALYPHLSAYDNIAFGLRMRKIEDKVIDKNGQEKTIKRHLTKQEIDEKVQWAAGILGIQELLARKPSEMSGGQCQRVALGRAIVRGPKLFLLDEPLSNLDAKLRTQMRSEIVKLQQRLGTTFIYVTHDQVEAMTMGTRIVVMKNGVTQQIDTPIELFNHPKNLFVAGFIGTPQMNFFHTSLQYNKKQDEIELTFVNGYKKVINYSSFKKIKPDYLDGNKHEVILGARAEHILLSSEGLPLTVSMLEVLGSNTQIYAKVENEEKETIISVLGIPNVSREDVINVTFNEEHIHLFAKETEVTIIEE